MANRKRKRKKSGWRIVLGILLALLILILAAGAATYFYVNSKLDKLSYTPAGTVTPPVYTEEEKNILKEEIQKDETVQITTSELPPEGEVAQDDDIVNILLLGTDMRIPYTSDPGRADAIQVISLNRSNGDIKLISFERGIMVPVPEVGTTLLTYSFRWAGPDYTLSLFRDYFLLDMAGYAHVDFEEFIQIIDALGGVDVELTEMEAWAIDPEYSHHLHEGMNHLDGALALHFCRLRSIDSNWHRVERQRKVIQAAIYKVKGMTLPELNALADQILPLIHTNLTKEQISSLLLSAPKFLGATAEQMTVPYREPGQAAHCDFQAEAERLKDFIYGPEG